MNWCFAIVNNKLAEVYYEREKEKIKFIGHAYVEEAKYKTKKERRYIKEDIARFMFVYRKGEYKRVGEELHTSP
jgi:hypothetical protein